MAGVVDITEFLRDKLNWHRRVMHDAQLTDLAKCVASLLLHDFDTRRDGEAYRSQEGLAAAANCSVRAIQKGLKQLADARHLEVTVARGRGHTNRYRFLRENTNAGSALQARQRANAGSGEVVENTNLGSEKHEPGFAQSLREKPSPLVPPSGAAAALQSGLAGRLVAVPLEIRDRIAAHPHYGEAFCSTWLDRCRFNPETREIHARSSLARGRIEERIGIDGLRQLDVTLGEPLPASLMGGEG